MIDNPKHRLVSSFHKNSTILLSTLNCVFSYVVKGVCQLDIMRGAVLVQVGQPLEIMDLMIPELSHGQVLVEMHYSGVCRSQLMEADGLRGEDRWLPHLLGHEGVGTVVQIGPGVSRFDEGDKVVLGWLKNHGCDVPGSLFKKKDSNLLVNSGPVTTLSTKTIVSENRLILLPEGIPDEVGVLLGCALPTGAGMVLTYPELRDNMTLAVVGLGGIGMSALLTAIALSGFHVIAIDVDDDRLQLAKEFGADQIINSQKQHVFEEVMRQYPSGVDVCFEAGGYCETIELGFSILNGTKGHLVFASHPESGGKISLDPHELIKGKKLSGSWGGGSNPEKIAQRLSDLFVLGKLPLERLIEKKYRFSQINDAFNDMREGVAIRPLIDLRQ